MFKSRIHTLSKIGTVSLFHCISKGFLFLQNWLRQFACIIQLVIIVIMLFFRDMQSRNRPLSMVIDVSHTYQWMCQANNHGWRAIPRLHCPVKSHSCTITESGYFNSLLNVGWKYFWAFSEKHQEKHFFILCGPFPLLYASCSSNICRIIQV